MTEPTKRNALIVDDDTKILAFVSRRLRYEGYEVQTAMNGEEALDAAVVQPPDVVLLDITMPVMDGIQTLTQLREWYEGPIIILSAIHEEQRKVEALDIGADDYLTKPFGIDELVARVRSAVRRADRMSQAHARTVPVLTADELEIDLARRIVKKSGDEVKLTRTEYELLSCLVSNAGTVMTHRELLREVWGPEYGDETEYLRTFVKQLRRKLEPDPSRPQYLLTQPGMGYRFAAPA